MFRRDWLARKTCCRIVVHTTTGKTIEGTLRENAPDGLVLEVARYVDLDELLPGAVFVHHDRVDFIQAVKA